MGKLAGLSTPTDRLRLYPIAARVQHLRCHSRINHDIETIMVLPFERDQVISKSGTLAYSRTLSTNSDDIARTSKFIARVFDRTALHQNCKVSVKTMELFCRELLRKIAPLDISVIGELPNNKLVSFAIQLGFPHPPTKSEQLSPDLQSLFPILKFLSALDETLLASVGLDPSSEVLPINRNQQTIHDLSNWRQEFTNACNRRSKRPNELQYGGVIQTLMIGCEAGSLYRGLAKAQLLSGLYQAYRRNQKFAVAQTIAPESTTICLSCCGRIALTVPFAAAPNQSPLRTMSKRIDDKLWDARLYNGEALCRVVVMNLDRLAVEQGWTCLRR